MPTGKYNLLELLANYSPVVASEMALRQEFLAFVDGAPDCCERSRLAGHLTGSAWLVSADGRHALLMHHRKLQRWLQPGGHADGDWDLAAVALREAQEESGLPDLVLIPGIFDLDKHRIPARGDVPEHWHYDLRFVVQATGSQVFTQNSESLALRWFDVAALATDTNQEASIRRMAHRWLQQRGFSRPPTVHPDIAG